MGMMAIGYGLMLRFCGPVTLSEGTSLPATGLTGFRRGFRPGRAGYLSKIRYRFLRSALQRSAGFTFP